MVASYPGSIPASCWMSVPYVHACTMCCCLGGLGYVMTLHCCSFVLHGILRWCVSSLVSAMPKVKHGWKGGPPPARRHSTRLTRPPARLVEATLDSSDSDVDTDVLRATNSGLQRRIQALEGGPVVRGRPQRPAFRRAFGVCPHCPALVGHGYCIVHPWSGATAWDVFDC